MCSIPNTRRPRLCMICTAVAPEAVVTRRTNVPIRPGYRPHDTRLVPPRRPKPLTTATKISQTATESQLRSDDDRLDVMPACCKPVGQPLQVAHSEQYGSPLGDRVGGRLNVQLGRVDTDPARLECHLYRVDDEVQSLFDRA